MKFSTVLLPCWESMSSLAICSSLGWFKFMAKEWYAVKKHFLCPLLTHAFLSFFINLWTSKNLMYICHCNRESFTYIICTLFGKAHPSSHSCPYVVQNLLTVHVRFLNHYFHIICSWISMLPSFRWILKNSFWTLVIFSEIVLLQSLPYNSIASNYFVKENVSMQFYVGSSLFLP